MDDMHRDRVAGTGYTDKLLEDAAELSRGVWNDLYSFGKQFSEKIKTEGKEDSTKVQSEKSPGQKNNAWRFDGKGQKEGLDRISMTASINVPADEFCKHNPDAAADLSRLIGKKDFRARHATTNELDQGWKLEGVNKDGTLRLSKDYHFDVQHKDSHNGLIEAMPGVSKEHVQALQKKLDQLPENIVAALRNQGYKIIATGINSQAIPELRGMTPRGWSKDTTFDSSDGTHDNVRRVILAPELFEQDGNLTPVDREEVVVHQIGHALDHALGKLSNKQDFQAAFKKDMEALAEKGDSMSDRERLIHDYFKQKRGPSKGENPGSEECFASLFGMLLTGPENPQDRVPFRQNFPNSIKTIEAMIRKL